MAENQIKFRLKGHESFYIREGWLRKGLKNVQLDKSIFTNERATDLLGVGSNMVKAIRYWLQASGLTQEIAAKGGKREQELTEGFGRIINEYDPYFEDIFSLWLVHYKIATNEELSTSWYLFFNGLNVNEFTKDEMYESMELALNRLINNASYSENSLHDDCSCIINTYCLDKKKDKNPEENIICPLTELGLMEKVKLDNSKEFYIKKKPSMDKLNKLIVLYIIVDRLNEDDNTSIDNLLNDKCNVGKILNLDRIMLNEYLDILRSEGYIDINRTAGLDKVYVTQKELTKEVILKEYYEQL